MDLERNTDGTAQTRPTGKNAALIAVNLILAVVMIFSASIYSSIIMNQKLTLKKDAFCTMVESMKQVSENYLSTEKGYADDWAAYIASCHMTAEEALDYIRTTNTQEDRAAHLVDMADFSARSTFARNGNPWVHCYEEQQKLATTDSSAFLDKMEQLFNAAPDEVLVLGKYRVGESQRTVVSVGTRVMIREADGSDRPYLLLRLIPVDYLQNTWAFPTEFPLAEISMIVNDGGYVVQSPSLRSRTFLDFIRAYNFPDDYNAVDSLAERLLTTENGLLTYKDSRGVDCYFYYSSFGEGSNIDILGYIPASQIQPEAVEWSIVLLVCGTLFLLFLIDGAYILSINQNLRRAVDMAEHANQAKTQFLSTMSHDIRTPMNAVIGMTEIAKLHLDDAGYVKDCLDKVSASSSHLLTLVNDILDISKVESGRMTLDPCAVSLSEEVEKLSGMVRPSAAVRGVAFTLRTQDITQDIVVTDPLRLRQVLINLLTNAVKYTEPGGHVLFAVSEEPSALAEHVRVRLVVSDDGIGMSEDFQRIMYTSFARATDSRINRIQGSGLGLAIVRQMTELMGGTIECVSAVGKGSTFTVTLDLPTARQLPRSAADSGTGGTADESLAGLRVLVAEDNDLNWEIVRTMLEEYGVLSDRAVNGQRCLEMLSAGGAPHYDLVLMDVQMPVMDGREATRRLRASEDPCLRELPVVAMTADAFAEDVLACRNAGMDGHIAKPINIKQVLQALHKAKSGTLRRNEETE